MNVVITRHTPLDQLPELLDASEVSTWLGIGRGKTYDLIRRGELPAVRFGRLVRIPRSALAAMVETQAVAS
jgi:excisionase family DNA binding protein